MAGRAAFVAAIFALAPLAGCVDDATPLVADGVNAPTAFVEPPPSMPDNRSGTFAAFEETDRTEEGVAGLDHAHDHWLGRDRVEILSRRFDVWRPPTENAARELDVPDGALVYEGTAAVEVLLKEPARHACFWMVTDDDGEPTACTHHVYGQPLVEPEDPAPPPVRLEYVHAATSEWIDAGEVVWGEPLLVPVAPHETDMPHATATLWRFRVVSDDPGAATLGFNATISILRGRDVPRWPGHPDFYADGHVRVVFDGTATTRDPGLVAGRASGDTVRHERDGPLRLVSYGTRAVHVHVNVTSIETPPAMVLGEWWLYWHNASGEWEAARPLVPPEDPAKPGALEFAIPVDEAGMDSPYAPESRWSFELSGRFVTPGPEEYRSYGPAFLPYAVDYRMTVLATDVPLDVA